MIDLGTLRAVKLSQCRRRRYLSQRDLAAVAGVAKATIVAIEKGHVKTPQLRIVRKISEALGVDPADVDEFRASLDLPPLPPSPSAD